MVAIYEGLRNFNPCQQQNKTSMLFVALIESLRHLSGIAIMDFMDFEVPPQAVPDAEKALLRLLYHTTQNVILMHQSIPAVPIPLGIGHFSTGCSPRARSWSTPTLTFFQPLNLLAFTGLNFLALVVLVVIL